MTIAQRSQFERLLQEERRRAAALLARIDPALGAEEAGRFGDDLASHAAAGATRDDDAAVAAHAKRELEALDSALRILYEEPERFGICDVCGRPIPIERLSVVPATRFCPRHADG